MTDYAGVDFLTDQSLVADPYPYYDYLREQSPVLRLQPHGFVAVTGYDEALGVYKNIEDFSSIVALGGPFPPLPFTPEGDDLNAQIDAHRTQFPMYEHMVTMDPPDHTRARSLLSRLLTPKRLKENEDFMWRLADRQLDEFLGEGHSEFLAEYAKPFSLLVIADLLGVPEEDHQEFRVVLGAERPGARVGSLDHESVGTNPLEFLDEKFSELPRGPARPAPRRRADRPGQREVPGRLHTGDHRRGAHRHLPVRRRPGDHRQAARRPRSRCSPSGPTSSRRCAPTAA